MKKDIYRGYESFLPNELITGDIDTVLANGLVSFVRPDMYEEILRENYSGADAIPFAVTAFGDILVWEKNKYVNIVSFSRHKVSVLESGFRFFFKDMQDFWFLNKYFNYDLFIELKTKLGNLNDSECFVANPIPYIQEPNSVDNYSVGKILEYNAISVELAGKL